MVCLSAMVLILTRFLSVFEGVAVLGSVVVLMVSIIGVVVVVGMM